MILNNFNLNKSNLDLSDMAKESTLQEIKAMLKEIQQSSESTADSVLALDDLLLASLAGIQCCGIIGQSFILTNNNTGQIKTHTLTNKDPIGNSHFYEKRIYVPLGEWHVYTSIENMGEASQTINATQTGYVYTFTYEFCNENLGQFTSNGTFTVPDLGVYALYASACGGGGGGAGGGGASGDCLYKNFVTKEVGKNYQIIIGTGGQGAASGGTGGTGTATKIGNTLIANGGKGASGASGGIAGPGGGNGGDRQSSNGSTGGTSILGGVGGSGGPYNKNNSGSGGGGGGGYGAGGDGASWSGTGANGGIGAGGGGSGMGTGGNGGNGIVIFYKGIKII